MDRLSLSAFACFACSAVKLGNGRSITTRGYRPRAAVTTQPLPLTRADDGTIRVTGSRVTFDSLIHQFKQGATAEQIHEDFPSLTLRDIYSAIAYYLHHTESVETYLREQDQAAAQTRQEMESQQDSSGLRERLRLRRAQCAP
jgi:uncharacterized protein (DUF433 family)